MNKKQCDHLSVSLLQEIVKDYLISHTAPNSYTGEVKYLELYKQYEEYLRQ